MGDITYINGLLVHSADAKVSAEDAGFLYGDGLFETMRVYGGRIFALDKHLDRLAKSAKELGILNLPSPARLKMIIEATIWANFDSDTVVRITITRGEPGAKDCTTVVQTRPSAYIAKDYEIGASCMTMPDPRGDISYLKTLNFLPNMLARREASRGGFLEAIFVDRNGLLTEGTVSNVFLVSKGVLRTPALNPGILNGLTRRIVLDMAKKAKISRVEEKIKVKDLLKAQEVFITNSVMEIMPVVSIDGRTIGDGKPGTVTQSLSERYQTLVEANAKTP